MAVSGFDDVGSIGIRGITVWERFVDLVEGVVETAVEFSPELAAQPDWMEHPEWFQPSAAEKEKLPRKLTPGQLARWRVDPPVSRTVDALFVC